MDKINLNALSLWERLKAPTSYIYKKAIKIALWCSGTASALLAAKGAGVIPDVIPAIVWTGCGWVIFAGVIVSAVSATTVDADKLQAQRDAQAAVNQSGVVSQAAETTEVQVNVPLATEMPAAPVAEAPVSSPPAETPPQG